MKKKYSGFEAIGSIPDFSSLTRYPVVLNNAFGGVPSIRNPARLAQVRRMAPEPTRHATAENIKVLVHALAREDIGRYLYRGQTKHYPSIIPSVYRQAIVPGCEADPVIAIDVERFEASLTKRQKVRYQLLSEMMKRFGASVGNVVAQQYGFNSEILDITHELSVAAFFATRVYPTYEHFSGSSDHPEGVIYRFPISERIDDVEFLDMLHKFGIKRIDPFGDVAFAAFTKWWDLPKGVEAALRNRFDMKGQAEIRTRPLVIQNSVFAKEIRSAWAKHLGTEVPSLKRTRLGRQAGGSIRTVSHWLATIPLDLAVIIVPRLGNMFDPPFAIGDSIMGIENISLYPGLEIFPFRHSEIAIHDLETTELWPSIETDWMYKHLQDVVRVTCADYLREEGVAVDDFASGLIDPGYKAVSAV